MIYEISVIKGTTDLCSIDLKNSPKKDTLKEHLAVIKQQVYRAKILVSNVMKLSQIEKDKQGIKKINAYLLLKDCIEYINRGFPERKIKIDIESHTENYVVRANELLTDVCENVLINAIIHNENPGVKILIRFSQVRKDGRNYLKIECIDNGIGIPDERKKRIFERETPKEVSEKGMGIGLTLVHTIIKSYNGKIWVENAVPGDYTKGSNFIILIPTTS